VPYIIGNPGPIPSTRLAVLCEKFTVDHRRRRRRVQCSLYTHTRTRFTVLKRREVKRYAKLAGGRRPGEHVAASRRRTDRGARKGASRSSHGRSPASSGACIFYQACTHGALHARQQLCGCGGRLTPLGHGWISISTTPFWRALIITEFLCFQASS
jgi:hypothetical protein